MMGKKQTGVNLNVDAYLVHHPCQQLCSKTNLAKVHKFPSRLATFRCLHLWLVARKVFLKESIPILFLLSDPFISQETPIAQ